MTNETINFYILIANLFIIASIFALDTSSKIFLLIVGFIWIFGCIFVMFLNNNLSHIKEKIRRVTFDIERLEHKAVVNKLDELTSAINNLNSSSIKIKHGKQ